MHTYRTLCIFLIVCCLSLARCSTQDKDTLTLWGPEEFKKAAQDLQDNIARAQEMVAKKATEAQRLAKLEEDLEKLSYKKNTVSEEINELNEEVEENGEADVHHLSKLKHDVMVLDERIEELEGNLERFPLFPSYIFESDTAGFNLVFNNSVVVESVDEARAFCQEHSGHGHGMFDENIRELIGRVEKWGMIGGVKKFGVKHKLALIGVSREKLDEPSKIRLHESMSATPRPNYGCDVYYDDDERGHDQDSKGGYSCANWLHPMSDKRWTGLQCEAM